MEQEIASGIASGKRSGEIVEDLQAQYGISVSRAYHIITDVREALLLPYQESLKKLAPMVLKEYWEIYYAQKDAGQWEKARATLDSIQRYCIGSAPLQVEVTDRQRFDFGGGFSVEDATDVEFEDAQNDAHDA